uniref:Uncharacterized protein n=1 Tax=Triticum urartu TaxID=4572 RepID=A0A8R7PIR3_TRIUA
MTASKLSRGESCLLHFLQIQSSPFSAAFMPKSLDRQHMQRRPAVSDSGDSLAPCFFKQGKSPRPRADRSASHGHQRLGARRSGWLKHNNLSLSGTYCMSLGTLAG